MIFGSMVAVCENNTYIDIAWKNIISTLENLKNAIITNEQSVWNM